MIKIKPRVTIFLLFVAFMLIGSFGSLGGFYVSTRNIVTQQTENYLDAIAQSRAEHVKTFVELIKDRAIDFSSDGKIKDCLQDINDNNSTDGCTHAELNRHLTVNKIPINKNLYEVFVLDKDGKVVGTTNPDEEFGEDFSTDEVFLNGKKKVFVRDIAWGEEFNQVGLAVSAPIMMGNEFLGVIINRIKPDTLYEILLESTGMGETGEIYLMNGGGFVISPLRFEDEFSLDRKVDSVHADKCLEDYALYDKDVELHKGHDFVGVYLNQSGKSILGTHAHIPEMRWCLLAEIDEREAVGLLRIELIKSAFIIAIIITIIMTFFIFLVNFLIKEIIKDIYSERKKTFEKAFIGAEKKDSGEAG